jgi:hypothetical protein
MKKFLQYTFLIFFLGIWAVVLVKKESVRDFVQSELKINQPCSKPVKYSIGSIDLKFNVSGEEVKAEAIKAEEIWDNSVNKNLLEYDPNSQFKINLIYDQRQEMTDKSEELSSKLDQLESEQDLITSEYNKLSGSLKKRTDNYKKDVADYQNRIKYFNKEVSYWNSQGGAPQDKYDKLKKEEKDLKSTADSLEEEKKVINNLILKSNSLATEENKIVGNYNSNINTYKSKYGGIREFEKGIFNGEAINIYEFQEMNDLELTLIHEFGHALGLDHTQNPQSIMYPMIGEQNMDNPALTSDDIAELKNVCKI